MVTRQQLANVLDDLLDPPAEMTDASNNGLQVEGAETIERVAFGVDASMALFQAAADWNAEAIVVHHGISWGPGFATIVGADARRLKLLLSRGLNLFAYHIPLDCHPTLGNNAQIVKRLELTDTCPFGRYGGIDIGFKGSLPEPMALDALQEYVHTRLQSRQTVVSATKNPAIRTLGVVSGGAADLAVQCPDKGADCLLTGEISHQHVHPIREAGVPVIAAGHYATEIWGLKALLERISETLPLDCRFIDLPTGY